MKFNIQSRLKQLDRERARVKRLEDSILKEFHQAITGLSPSFGLPLTQLLESEPVVVVRKPRKNITARLRAKIQATDVPGRQQTWAQIAKRYDVSLASVLNIVGEKRAARNVPPPSQKKTVLVKAKK